MQDENHEAVLIDEALQQDAADEPIITIAYKHKTIARFSTGVNDPSRGLHKFDFHDHIMRITGTQSEVEALNAEWLELYRGLISVDKINIVKLRNVQNEESIRLAPDTVRGPVGTAGIADKEVVQPVPAQKTGGFSFKLGGA